MKRLGMVLLLVACGSKKDEAPPGQSFHDAMVLICGIPDLVVNAIADVTIRQREINTWFHANVKNPDAIKWYLEISTVQPGERRAYIQAAATKAGIEPCAYAKRYNPMPESVPIPKP